MPNKRLNKTELEALLKRKQVEITLLLEDAKQNEERIESLHAQQAAFKAAHLAEIELLKNPPVINPFPEVTGKRRNQLLLHNKMRHDGS